MTTIERAVSLTGVALLAALAAGCASLLPPDPDARRGLAEVAVMNWFAPCRVLAVSVMEKYGSPDEIRRDRLVWKDRHPWNRIEVRDGILTDEDSLTQTVAYIVPDDRRQALADFTTRLTASRRGDELSSRSSDEKLNLLTLNLADRIVTGRLDPAEAAMLYDRKVELAAAGKDSPEMRGLLFKPQR